MPVIMKDNVQYAYTTKGTVFHTLSNAEYEALTEEEKMNGDVYCIPDREPILNPDQLWEKVGTGTLDIGDDLTDGVNQLNSRFVDYIVFRSKNLGSITMQANATGSASYNLDDVTGYKPLGILGYTGSGTTGTVLQECYMSGTTGYVYIRNMTSSQKTVTNVTLNVLYVKTAS